MLKELLDVLEDMQIDDQEDLIEQLSALSLEHVDLNINTLSLSTPTLKIIFHGTHIEVLTQRKKYCLPCGSKSKIQCIPWIA